MIVRSARDRVLLITQPDHAHAAREVMQRCVPLAGRERRDSILRAIGKHDAGWGEEDAAPLADPDTGEVVDFVRVPVEVRQRVWWRTLGILEHDSWAAALVANHAATVYERYRPAAEWTVFFAEMDRTRDALLRSCGRSRADLEEDYAFLRLGDLVSLVFCTGGEGEQRFRDWTLRPDGPRLVVSPDPFGGAEVPIEVAARELPNRQWRSDAELRHALAEARGTTLAGTVAAPP